MRDAQRLHCLSDIVGADDLGPIHDRKDVRRD
jgi:hypothetical protein